MPGSTIVIGLRPFGIVQGKTTPKIFTSSICHADAGEQIMLATSFFSVTAVLKWLIDGLLQIGLIASHASCAERILTNGRSSICHRAGLVTAERT